METPPGSKPRKRRSRKQRSYLSGSIAKQQGTLQELQAQCQALQQEQQLLQRRAWAASQGMQVADEALLQLVAARTALARSTQRLQLDAQRYSLTLDSFPPPEAWGPAMATFSGEQLRFITFDMLRLSLHMTRTNPDQLPAYVAKGARFILLQLSHNTDTWMRGVKHRNLLTGEPVPSNIYETTMASVPLNAIPVDMLYKLQAGLVRYRSSIASILQHSAVLQRRLQRAIAVAACQRCGSAEADTGAGQGEALLSCSSGRGDSGCSGTGGSHGTGGVSGFGSLPLAPQLSVLLEQRRASASSLARRMAMLAQPLRRHGGAGVGACMDGLPYPPHLPHHPHCVVTDTSQPQASAPVAGHPPERTLPSAPCTPAKVWGATPPWGAEAAQGACEGEPPDLPQAGDAISHIDSLLEEMQQANIRLMQAQSTIYPRDYLQPNGPAVSTSILTILLMKTVQPYQFDVALVSEALVARAVREGRIVGHPPDLDPNLDLS